MKKYLTILLSLFVVSGCSNDFGCNQYPETGCQPVSAVYKKTNAGYVDYRKSLYAEDNKDKVTSVNKTHRYKNGKRISRERNVERVNISSAHRALNHASPGDQILTKPVVMRILFDGWVDKEKDLHTGGFVFIKLRDSEWVLNN